MDVRAVDAAPYEPPPQLLVPSPIAATSTNAARRLQALDKIFTDTMSGATVDDPLGEELLAELLR